MAESIPVTGVYKEKQNLAQRAYQQAIAEIASQRGKALSQYGFSADVDSETGAVRSYQVDPANAYGSLQQAKNEYGRTYRAQQDSIYERGLDPTQGLGALPMSELRYDQGVVETNLGRGFLDTMESLARGMSDARSNLSQAMLSAEQEAIMASIDERRFQQVQQAQTSQFQQEMTQRQAELAASMQQLQMGASAGDMGGYSMDMSGMSQPQDPYAGMQTITAYEAAIMAQYGKTKGKNRPDWVKQIFQAHPGYLSGAQEYVLIG